MNYIKEDNTINIDKLQEIRRYVNNRKRKEIVIYYE